MKLNNYGLRVSPFTKLNKNNNYSLEILNKNCSNDAHGVKNCPSLWITILYEIYKVIFKHLLNLLAKFG